MVRILGYSSSADTDSEEPREITRTPSSSGDNGWLIRFFDSAFFCEWIAVSYLFKHEHAGVRDYLCNRMYSLPITGIENYLFQLCSMTLSKPLASLDKYIVDICTQSLKIAVKVHWFLVAEAEDLIDNDGIFRLQEKCQMAVLTGDWPPLIKHQKAVTSPSGKSRMFKLLSSRRLLPLTSPQKSSMSSTGEEGFRESSATVKCTAEESESSLKVFKKLMPGPKVRDAIFKKFRDKEEDDGEQPKEGEQESFFHRLFREKDDEERAVRSEELATTESFFRRLFRDKTDSEDRTASRVSEDEVKGLVFLFRKLFREKHDDRDKIDDEEKTNGSWDEDEAPEFFLFRKFLRVHPEDEGKTSPSIFDSATFGTPENSPETDGFFKRLFKDRPLDRKEDRSSPSSFLKRLFKERIEDVSLSEDAVNSESCEVDCSSENSRSSRLRSRNGYHGTDDSADSTSQQHQLERLPSAKLNFEDIPTESGSAPVREEEKPTPATPSEKPSAISAAHKFFTSSDWSLLSNGKSSAKRPGSPKQRTQRGCSKPPLPRYSSFHIRKGSYYATLDFFKSLCEIASGLVDVFPVEDRRKALHESLTELNNHLKSAENDGGVCFPMGKGICRVVHIPEEEAILMSSREKAPYLVCFEVLKCENKSSDKDKDAVANKLPRGIPLANGDAHLQRPPPWAYPIWNQYDAHQTGSEHYLRTASQAIDRAMSHDWETNVKFVELSMSTQEEGEDDDEVDGGRRGNSVVRVNLRALVDLNMEDVEEEFPPRRKDHRRVPSTIAMAEVRAAAAKGEAPLGLPLKTSGTEPDEVEKNAKATDALAGEIWGFKRERIRNSSAFGALPGWDLRSAIVKSGDDCRQEHLAVQLVAHFYDIFQEAGLPLWLRPYEVLVTSSRAALIETIPDTASIHAIKSRNLNLCSLREFFCKKYDENSPGFKLAQRNFVESMAGYSILCYVLQVKDRHNGNLLIDEDGHVIHIDFGFMLSNSPGGVNFENVPFKLTRELLEVMDSDAEGTASEFFDYFKVLCIQGFLTCRKHAERIILLVEMMQDSGCPCFKGGAKTMQNLRKRFHLNLTEEQCVSLVLSLISNSLDAWRTRQYDYYQRVLNGIL